MFMVNHPLLLGPRPGSFFASSFFRLFRVSQPRSLQRLLADRGEGLERLLTRASALAELDRRLRRHLPPSLADVVSVANLRDGVLVLRTTSAEWRTRVHFLAPQLIEALRADPSTPNIAEIRIRITPAVRQEEPRRSGPSLSAAAAHLLQATAQSLDDDPLRLALARLAARHRTNK
jgi:hypothetical protein